MKRLDEDVIEAELAKLHGWVHDAGAGTLARTFEFEDFIAAFGFMTACAMEAEKLEHHPDWSNSYGTVSVVLSTHSAGGITELDIELAEFMDAVALGMRGKH